MFTSAPDFKLELTLAQRSLPEVADTINGFVAKYEPLFLTELLGADLYADLLAGLVAQPPLTKWTTLRDKVKPCVVPYVYWYYRDDNASQTTGTGETIAENENSRVITPARKMAKRWNEMVKLNLGVIAFINSRTEDYGAYYNPSWVAYVGTTYGFGTMVSGCIPEILKNRNSWGL